MAGENKVTIKIPRKLYENIKQVTDDSGFNSVTDFVVYCLRDIVSTKDADNKKLTPEQTKQVQDRLKKLGYL